MVSANIRAALRNLYINGVISLMIIAWFFLQRAQILATPTAQLEQYLYLAQIAVLIAWVLFLIHCCGELVLELRRRSNYHYLWSLLPFFLPVTIYLAQNPIVDWLIAHSFFKE